MVFERLKGFIISFVSFLISFKLIDLIKKFIENNIKLNPFFNEILLIFLVFILAFLIFPFIITRLLELIRR